MVKTTAMAAARFTFLLLLAAAAAAASAASASAAGGAIAASLSQAGASSLLAALVPLLEARVGALPIPDLPFDQDGFTGGVTSIHCENLVVGASEVTLGAPQPSEVALALNSISVKCSANWNFKLKIWPHKPDGSGSVDIAVSSTSASVAAAVAVAGLHPQLQCGAAGVTVGNIDLTFHGSALDWIIDLFKGDIEGAVKKALQSDFAGIVASFINTDVNAELAGLNLDLAIKAVPPYNISEARFGFLAAPVVNSSFMGVSLQGDVVALAAPDAPLPIAPPALPPFSPSSAGTHFIEALISPYTLLSAAYTFFAAGLLSWPVPPADLPLGFNVSGAYKLVAPGFVAAYPSGASVALAVSVEAMPDCTATAAEGVSVALPLLVAFLGQAANGSFMEGFALNLGASLSLSLAVAPNPLVPGGSKLTGQLGFVDAAVSLNSSSVGAVDVGLLGLFANVTVQLVLVPIFDALLGVGLPLPATSGLALTNASVATGDGYLLFGADFTFAPSAAFAARAAAAARKDSAAFAAAARGSRK